MNVRILLSSVLGVTLFGLAQLSSADWADGPCIDPTQAPPEHENAGPAPCFDAQVGDDWYHFNGDGSHANDWHGQPGTGDDFVFCGQTRLQCGPLLGATCTLCLVGDVMKSPAWIIHVRVKSGSVTGGGLCGGISVGGFPWYAGPNSMHSGHGPGTGIPYTAPLVGSMGPIDMSAFGIINHTGTHMHDITYDNATSSFVFDGPLLYSDESSTGCTVDGSLQVQSPIQALHIH